MCLCLADNRMVLKMIVILRLAAGILLAGIIFWAISNLINWMRSSLNNYKIKRNQPRTTEEELRNRRLNNKEKVRKLVIIYFCLCAALVLRRKSVFDGNKIQVKFIVLIWFPKSRSVTFPKIIEIKY